MSELHYTLTLKDAISGKLQKIAVTSDNALNKFSKLQRQARDTNRLMKDMGGSVGALREKLNLLRNERDWIPASQQNSIRNYNRQINKLERDVNRMESQTGGKMRGMFKSAFAQIPFANLLTNPLVLAGAAGFKGVKNAGELEMQRTSFSVILNSESAAKKMVDDIAKYADKTPYAKQGLGKAAQTMLGFGVASDKIMPNLRAIGDIAMGDAQRMDSLSLAFAQSQAAGKLMGQDLLQMVNAGFNPLMQISKTTGKSIGVLRKEMENGGISSAMLEQAFIGATSAGGKYHGMADKMSETFRGKLSTLMDKFNTKLANLGTVIIPMLMPLMNGLIWTMDTIGNSFGWLVDQFNNGNPLIVGLTVVVGALTASMLLQSTWAGILTIKNAILTGSFWGLNIAMLANPVTWIVAGVIALIAVIAYLVMKIDGWGKLWTNTMNLMKFAFKAYVNNLKLGWIGVRNVFLTGIDQIKIAWYKLKGLWDKEGAKNGLAAIQRASDKRKAEYAQQKGFLKSDLLNAKKSAIGMTTSLSWNKTSLSDVKNKLSGALGIAPPTTNPGAANIAGGKGTAGASMAKSNNAIATGGTKNTTNNFTFKNLAEIGSINAASAKEGVDKLQEMVQDALLRALATANLTAG